MLDERGGGRARAAWAVAGAALLLAPHAASGQTLTGRLLVQYQDVEQHLLLAAGDGAAQPFTLRRSTWIQTYEVTHSAIYGERLNSFIQFRLNRITYPGLADRATTPYATARLIHPYFGVIGTYSPSTIRSTISRSSFGTGGGLPGQGEVIRTKTAETQFDAYLAVPRAPRLDLSWARRRRETEFYRNGETGLTRHAGMTWDLGALNLHGGLGDVRRAVPGGGTNALQKSAEGGLSYHVALRDRGELATTYDYNQAGRTSAVRQRTHNASLTGSLRQSARDQWSLFSSWRRALNPGTIARRQDDYEASLFLQHDFARTTRLTVGPGLRTDRPVGSTGSDVLHYLMGMLQTEGDVRHGWRALSSLSHTTNWAPRRTAFSLDTWRVGTTMALRRGLDLNGDWQVTHNSDPLANGARVVTQSSARLQAVPVRTFNLDLNARWYRSGSGLFRPVSLQRSVGLDVRWLPGGGLSLLGNLTRNGRGRAGEPSSSTRQATLQWTGATLLQVQATYTYDTQQMSSATANQLSGHEIWSTRLLLTPVTNTILSVSYNVADRGRPNDSRQFDAALTMNFGR